MYCPNCGAQNPEEASFCARCGTKLASGQPTPTVSCPTCGAQNSSTASTCVQCQADLPRTLPPQHDIAPSSLGRRIGAQAIDMALGLIPYLGVIPAFVNLAMYRRGTTIGLKLVGARIIRENGDVSGLIHTYVRSAAALLSAVPLGLGYFWAIWDPEKQTWHDKIMHTFVLRDTEELAARRGSSSTKARVVFWALFVVLPIVLSILAVLMVPDLGRYLRY